MEAKRGIDIAFRLHRWPPREWVLALVVAVALVGAAACQPPDVTTDRGSRAEQVAPPPKSFDATVVRVVDGDTLVARRDGRQVRVRLIGIDAPESVQPEAPVECFGRDSAEHLRSVLPPGTSVRAGFQGEDRQDRFGRELWDVWLPDGALLQHVLVRGGFAYARAYQPHTRYAKSLAQAERAAREEGAGMHAACPHALR